MHVKDTTAIKAIRIEYFVAIVAPNFSNDAPCITRLKVILQLFLIFR